jgi:ABC-type branched-subunit amino acid transport system substrate-binding protein
MALGMMDLVDIGGELVGSEYLSGVGEAGNGAYTSVGSAPLGLNEDLDAMAERLFERVGQYPEPLGLKFYEAVYIFADAMERAGTTEYEALCQALRETDMTGPVTHWHLAFDEWGRMKYPVTYMMQQTAPGVQELGEVIEGSYPPQEE